MASWTWKWCVPNTLKVLLVFTVLFVALFYCFVISFHLSFLFCWDGFVMRSEGRDSTCAALKEGIWFVRVRIFLRKITWETVGKVFKWRFVQNMPCQAMNCTGRNISEMVLVPKKENGLKKEETLFITKRWGAVLVIIEWWQLKCAKLCCSSVVTMHGGQFMKWYRCWRRLSSSFTVFGRC